MTDPHPSRVTVGAAPYFTTGLACRVDHVHTFTEPTRDLLTTLSALDREMSRTKNVNYAAELGSEWDQIADEIARRKVCGATYD